MPRKVPQEGTDAAPVLRRTLGLWQVSLSGIGVILGAGVYALIGPAAGLAGNVLWLAFLVAGAAAGLTAYSYARLGAMRPKDSPEFQYTTLTRRDPHRLLAELAYRPPGHYRVNDGHGYVTVIASRST